MGTMTKSLVIVTPGQNGGTLAGQVQYVVSVKGTTLSGFATNRNRKFVIFELRDVI